MRITRATIRGVVIEAGEELKQVNADYHILKSVDVSPLHRPKICIKQSSHIVICLADARDEKKNSEVLVSDVVVALVLRHRNVSGGA